GLAGEVLLLLEERLEHGHPLLEPQVAVAHAAQIDVAVPRRGDAAHGPGHPVLEGRQDGEDPALEERRPAPAVHLVRDDHEVGEHEGHEEDAALAGVDDAAHGPTDSPRRTQSSAEHAETSL